VCARAGEWGEGGRGCAIVCMRECRRQDPRVAETEEVHTREIEEKTAAIEQIRCEWTRPPLLPLSQVS
jgi:hypothetical protein